MWGLCRQQLQDSMQRQAKNDAQQDQAVERAARLEAERKQAELDARAAARARLLADVAQGCREQAALLERRRYAPAQLDTLCTRMLNCPASRARDRPLCSSSQQGVVPLAGYACRSGVGVMDPRANHHEGPKRMTCKGMNSRDLLAVGECSGVFAS